MHFIAEIISGLSLIVIILLKMKNLAEETVEIVGALACQARVVEKKEEKSAELTRFQNVIGSKSGTMDL
jgi:hypothetical protein